MLPQSNHGGQDPKNKLLDIYTKGKSDEFKGRLYQFVRDADIDADDPTFILVACMGNLDALMLEFPKLIGLETKKIIVEINVVVVQFRKIITDEIERQEKQRLDTRALQQQPRHSLLSLLRLKHHRT